MESWLGGGGGDSPRGAAGQGYPFSRGIHADFGWPETEGRWSDLLLERVITNWSLTVCTSNNANSSSAVAAIQTPPIRLASDQGWTGPETSTRPGLPGWSGSPARLHRRRRSERNSRTSRHSHPRTDNRRCARAVSRASNRDHRQSPYGSSRSSVRPTAGRDRAAADCAPRSTDFAWLVAAREPYFHCLRWSVERGGGLCKRQHAPLAQAVVS